MTRARIGSVDFLQNFAIGRKEICILEFCMWRFCFSSHKSFCSCRFFHSCMAWSFVTFCWHLASPRWPASTRETLSPVLFFFFPVINTFMRISQKCHVFPQRLWSFNSISVLFLVFPKMLSQTNSIDLNTRHGNILGCAEVTHALYLYARQSGRYRILQYRTSLTY